MSEQAHETTRIFVTGTCDGLQPLLEALAENEELELLGSNEHIAAAAPVLAGGHLQVVLHATRSSVLADQRAGCDPRVDTSPGHLDLLERGLGPAR